MDIQNTIHGLFENQTEKTPNNIAAIYEGQFQTYEELNQNANQLAHYLRELGVEPNTQVALCMDRSIDLLIALFAILKSGGSYVPLDPLHPEARLMNTLTDSNVRLVLTSCKHEDKLISYPGTLIAIDSHESEIKKQPTSNPGIDTPSDLLAYIIYTSGSTGQPKGVLIEHKSVINYCHWFAQYTSCQPNQRVDFSSNYIFDMAVTTSLVPLMLGLTIVISHDKVNKGPRHYLKYLAANSVNLIKMTPSYFKVLLHEVQTNPCDLPHLKNIILGGENLPTSDCASWLKMYPEHILFNEYGPTEATVAVSQHKICQSNIDSLGTNVPIGQAGPNIFCYVLDAENNPVPDGEVGELFIGGVCLARGYLNQPVLTDKAFVRNPYTQSHTDRLYKTGDLCRRLPNDVIEYIGRIDHQIKIRGFRIEPGEVERCLIRHPNIKDAVVLVQQDDLDQKLIAYYIVNHHQREPSDSAIHQYLETHLPDYMIPSSCVKIDSFPLTANGKLDRHALPIPKFISNHIYLAPTTTLERTLAEIWSEELGHELIGIEDNFFELGGHSLSAARIISKINSTLKKDITLRDFYEAATIKSLIPLLYSAQNIDDISAPTSKTETDDDTILPFSDFQLLLWLSNTFEPRVKRMNIVARKRLQGRLDNSALTFAFTALFKKHEIFFSQILKTRPAARLIKSIPFTIVEKNIESLSLKNSELLLESSMNGLLNHHSWKKNNPLIFVKLFHLANGEDELQVCIPHMISDDLCLDIVYADLSTFYLLYNDQFNLDTIQVDKWFRYYQFHEQQQAISYLNRDMQFWKNYLKDVSLLTIPSEFIVKNMKASGFAYSTYAELPEPGLKRIQKFCAINQISINDGLCAILGLALIRCVDQFGENNQNIYINIVKCARENQLYDHTVGCFLRLEPIKLGLNRKATLLGLAKQIHQTRIDTSAYQQSPALVKVAHIGELRKQNNTIKKYGLGALIYLYTLLFRTPSIERKTLGFCHRITSLKKLKSFVVNINVHRSFISKEQKNPSELFGLKTKKTKTNQHDQIQIDQFLDICFQRDPNHNTPYVVISANLTPAFRQMIAKEMIQIINQEPLHKTPLISTSFLPQTSYQIE